MIDVRNQFAKPEGHAQHTPAQQIGIAVHHSVTSNLPASATQAEELAVLRAIESYHISIEYGLFGYHLAAFPSGRLYYVGTVLGQRAHVAKRNHELTGICAIGTFTDQLPGKAQMEAIAEGIRFVRNTVGKYLPAKGHNLWAAPGWGTACAGTMNNIPERLWDQIAADQPTVVTVLEDKVGLLHRWGGLANEPFFSGMEIDGRIQNVWMKSTVPGDVNVPAQATSVLVTIYLEAGGIDLLDGAGMKAGFCPPGVTTHKVFLDASERGNILLKGYGARLDKIEVLGWYE